MSQKTHSLQRGVRQLAKYEKVRFVMVGSVNTLVDFAVLVILATMIGLPAIIANVLSTSCALAVSFLLNKKAVFGDTDPHNRQQLVLFIIVTLSGVWVLQGVLILAISSWLQLLALGTTESLLLAKVIATVGSLVWNYVWYSRVVFKKRSM